MNSKIADSKLTELKLKKLNLTKLKLVLLPLLLLSSICHAQLSESADWAARAAADYLIYPDRVYGVANTSQLKLDVWQKQNTKEPAPTLIYIHGGGWIFGDRTGATLQFLPYIQMGWNVVNVEYRMASASPAPAAVEDCRCALRWVVQHASEYNIDTNRIVLTGHSAGGHLSLITGLLTPDAGLDNQCFGPETPKVAAIINWYGISDVADLLAGPDLRNYAVMWLGSQPDRVAIAKRVSPLAYIHAGNAPVFTVHGDADPVVPYSQAVRLHQALTQAGVKNQLLTIHGGGHGGFTPEQYQDAFVKINAFLKAQGVIH
jgi:acetyl esterase/lipase